LFYHKNMGAWNFGPLDNDAALDELQMLFDTSDLVDRVRTSLERGLHDGCNEIRATAYLVYVLVKHDLWPHDTRQAITSLAVTRLSQMSAENVYGNADFMDDLRHLIKQLRAVDRSPQHDADPPQWEF